MLLLQAVCTRLYLLHSRRPGWTHCACTWRADLPGQAPARRGGLMARTRARHTAGEPGGSGSAGHLAAETGSDSSMSSGRRVVRRRPSRAGIQASRRKKDISSRWLWCWWWSSWWSRWRAFPAFNSIKRNVAINFPASRIRTRARARGAVEGAPWLRKCRLQTEDVASRSK